MRTLKIHSHLSYQELKRITFSQTNSKDFLDWQVIYSVQNNLGKKAEEIASVLGISIYKVYRLVEKYNAQGKAWKEANSWGGRRDATCYLSISQERKLLESLGKKAMKGKILTASSIKKEVEAKIGHKVSEDYIWDMFTRHNWKKKSPRPKHPKSSKKPQEEFKKNLKKTWMPID